MSLSEVRPYFRARMNSLGYKEWEDAFNYQNIPDTIVDGSYHIEANNISATSFNQTGLDLNHTVTVRLFIKGFRTPKDAIDSAMIKLDAIYRDILKPANRLGTGGELRNVLLQDTSLDQINSTNDNAVLVTMTFLAKVYLGICE